VVEKMKGGRAMKSRGPYVLIGVLIGIIIMQWAMPMATAQANGIVHASGFALWDEAGEEITAFLANDSGAPFLVLGNSESANIILATDGESTKVRLSDPAESVRIDIGTSPPLIKISDLLSDQYVSLSYKRDGVSRIVLQGREADLLLVDDRGHSVQAGITSTGGSLEMRRLGSRTASMPGLVGDLDLDQDVDYDDFFLFAANFGTRASRTAAKAVLEEPVVPVADWDLTAAARQKRDELMRQR
jgi:hypothetical protein